MDNSTLSSSADSVVSEPDNAVIHILYNALKTAYLELRQQRTRTRTCRIASKYDSHFWQLAKFVHANCISPFEYMDWCFDRMLDVHSDVFPNMVTSPALLCEFLDGKTDRDEELELIVGLQADLVSHRLSRGDSLSTILLDENEALSSVMRFAIALNVGDATLASNFERGARELLVIRPYYKKLLGKYLPEDMR